MLVQIRSSARFLALVSPPSLNSANQNSGSPARIMGIGSIDLHLGNFLHKITGVHIVTDAGRGQPCSLVFFYIQVE
jgi:hypothetical protein